MILPRGLLPTLSLAIAIAAAAQAAGASETGLTAPAPPTGLIWTVNKLGQISLSWQPGGGDAPDQFRVFRNGAELAAVHSASYVDSTVAPGATYTYAIVASDDDGRTSPASEPLTVTALRSASAVFAGTGDIAYEGQGDEATAKLVDEVVRQSPDAVIFTAGDNAYPSGSAEQFASFFTPTWGRHKARLKPVPGNHDYRSAGAEPYFQYFGAAAGEPGKGYYSYDLGEWHIIALNSEIDIDEGSPQIEWLRSDLAANGKACILAYFHEPKFSSGKGEGSTRRVDAIWTALYEFGADVIVNGHEHSYERFGPQTPDGVADPVHGIRQFVVGTGGVSLYKFAEPLPNSLVRNDATYGIIRFTLNPSSFDWQFIPVAGSTFTDFGRENCSLSRPPKPPRRLLRSVSASPDDALESTVDGAVNLTSTGVYLGAYGDGVPQLSGLRFAAVHVPKGATIVNATIAFLPRDAGTDPTTVTIAGEAADSSLPFGAGAKNLSARPATAASVTWDVPQWKDLRLSPHLHETPALTAIVQEIIDRPGWQDGNAMSFLIHGKGSRVARSFDYKAEDSPLLRIDFIAPGSTP
jgi:3',5'-cyclic AMP phosphodiesterase CpdA